ncbi:MAG: hypothetical protein IV090_00075 [Candidatus Sericytochromatia bacterium]|nr:hypothetical protein [Candidatus Sericytochromatia bacterium]
MWTRISISLIMGLICGWFLLGCSPLVAIFLMTPEQVTQPFLNPSPSPSLFSQENPL